MSNRRQRFVFGAAATLVGVLMFVVASAYIVFRGHPHWLAAIVGALAFPVGPVTWQLLGERARKKKLATAKTPAKATLTAGDRYWLRCIAVALVVIGPMIAVGRFNVARATWRNGLWFVPTHYEPTTTHGSPLSMIGYGARSIDVLGTPLARVPADAELVVMAHSPEDSKNERGVLAYGDKQVMFFAEGSGIESKEEITKGLAELNKERGRIPWLQFDAVQLVSHSDGQVLAATSAWGTKVQFPGIGPNAELLRELGRAPKDAFLVAGFVPKTLRAALPIKSGAFWIYKSGEKVVLEGRLEANDEAGAKRLVGDASDELDAAVHDVPESCRDQVGKIVKAIQLDQTGAVVTGRIELDGGAVMGVMFCAMKDR